MTDLIACYWTLAGAAHSTPARFSFEERVVAAAKAGFTGIGLRYDDYSACRARGLTDADLRRILDDAGIGVPELEFITGWSSDDESMREGARAIEEQLYAAANAFGSRHINCGCAEAHGELPALDAVVERFGAMCDRAATHGLKVALEFMPWTGMPDAATAWEIVSRAGCANGGLLVDSWHYFRGNADPEALRRVPAESIVAVQLDDADAQIVGSMREDTLRRRRLPGEGVFDLIGLVRLLDERGVDAPYGVEMIADSNATHDLDALAQRAFETTDALLAKARA